jgi:hypothetical protein
MLHNITQAGVIVLVGGITRSACMNYLFNMDNTYLVEVVCDGASVTSIVITTVFLSIYL